LRGWRFHFADDVVAPAELPATVLAYKNQQARWATGATQCLTKYAAPIWHAPEHSLLARLYALLSMSAYSTHLLLLLVLLVQLPLLLSGYRLPAWLILFSVLGLGQPLLFLLAQQVLYRDWPRRVRHMPALLLLAVGTAPSNTWAPQLSPARRGHGVGRGGLCPLLVGGSRSGPADQQRRGDLPALVGRPGLRLRRSARLAREPHHDLVFQISPQPNDFAYQYQIFQSGY
jgi:hypothetical protein